MAERIYEEIAVIIKKKYSVRLLEYIEGGKEFTEINVYNKEVTGRNYNLSEYFTFGFTVKGKAEEEKEKLEKMNDIEFEEFVKHMEHFIEKKYHIFPIKEEKIIKKENKEEEEKEELEQELGLKKEEEDTLPDIPNFEEEDTDSGPDTDL